MHEDKLTHDERLRLEALAQAIALNAMKPNVSAEQIVQTAKTFERYISANSA